MKKTVLSLLAVAAIAWAFTSKNQKNLAEVEQIQGLYVFVKCKPIQDYEFLGTVKPGLLGSHTFDNLLEMSIKKARKEFPEADAIIFESSIKQTHNTKVSAIKFKQ